MKDSLRQLFSNFQLKVTALGALLIQINFAQSWLDNFHGLVLGSCSFATTTFILFQVVILVFMFSPLISEHFELPHRKVEINQVLMVVLVLHAFLSPHYMDSVLDTWMFENPEWFVESCSE